MAEKQKIISFKGKYAFLSNFHPCLVEYEGILYPSAEHAFQASKSLNPKVREVFRTYCTPADAKYFGKRVTLRSDWEEVKVQVMMDIVKDKFLRNRSLGFDMQQALLATGDTRLENGNNYHDTFWGTVKGEGQNHLGLILMEIRSMLREESVK